MSGSTVLIVDDEQTLARSAKAFLADHGYEAEVAASGEKALELLERLQPDVVFADVRLPGMSGIDLLKRIREFDPVLPVIMLTAYGSIEGAVEAVKLGAFDYVKKPVDLEELKLLADRARENRLLKQELSYYRRRATRDVAFADAKESKPGLVEAAEGGFLFLDEIGDVDLSVQGKLLRAIEERTVRRIGSVRERKVDVRIVAATNRDLEREATRERFRRDLYFRLAVIVLVVPPLRERGEDVLLLTDHFLRVLNAKYGKTVREISAPARELLLSYPWPGNVRELSHVIERAVLWSRGPTLDVEHLSLTSPDHGTAPAEVGAGAPALPPQGVDLAHWEKSMIERAMREAAGNQTKAAQRLGISRDTLRYRLKKFGLQH